LQLRRVLSRSHRGHGIFVLNSTATLLGYGVFLGGAADGHIRDILQSGNWSINNAGPMLVLDVFVPIFLLSLLALSTYGRRRAA
jgi:hypothetical protein